MAWSDERHFADLPGNDQIYFTMAAPDGGKIMDDVRISSLEYSAIEPQIYFTGSEFGIFWYGGGDIRHAGVDVDGNKTDETVIANANGAASFFAIFQETAYALFWQDPDLVWHMSRLSLEGEILSSSDLSVSSIQSIACSGSDYGLVYEEEISATESHLFFVRIQEDGNTTEEPLLVSSKPALHLNPKVQGYDHEFGMVYATMQTVTLEETADTIRYEDTYQLYFSSVAFPGPIQTAALDLHSAVYEEQIDISDLHARSNCYYPVSIAYSGSELAVFWAAGPKANPVTYFTRVRCQEN